MTHNAIQMLDAHGRPFTVKGSVCFGKDNKGRLLYKIGTGTLWDLDGYEAFIPTGYIPVYAEDSKEWTYIPLGQAEMKL